MKVMNGKGDYQMIKPLHEMTNEELAHEEYMACMVADDAFHYYFSLPDDHEDKPELEPTLASHEAYIEKVHAEIARRGLRAVTRNNKTVLLPVDNEHPVKFWKPPHRRIDPWSSRWDEYDWSDEAEMEE